MVSNLRRRIARTIPFGYKLYKDDKNLHPIKLELDTLKNIKKKIFKGKITARKASLEIEHETGRKLSHVALIKMMNIEYPNWQINANKEIKRFQIEKRKKILDQKLIKKKDREIEKLRIREEKKIKYRNCIICGEKKLLDEFKENKALYCYNCKELLDKESSSISLNCRICGKKKELNNFIGNDGFKKYKTKTCLTCNKIYNKDWNQRNIEKRKVSRKRYIEKNKDFLKIKAKEYRLKNKDKLQKIFELNKEKIYKRKKLRILFLKKNEPDKYKKILEKRKAYAKKTRLVNPEKARSKDREYYKKTREKRIESVMKWKKNNMDKVIRIRRRYSLKRNELASNKKSLW
tara:strand:+ start:1314 stop:2354 length:1041 start_codon:yes stop_codon:yes gene_type:complete